MERYPQSIYIIRQSNLRALEEQCPAMAYALAVQGREGVTTGGAVRGTVIHEIFAAYVYYLHGAGRQTDWEQCANITQNILAEYPELNYEQRQDVIAQADNIARGYVFEPDIYYGTEESFQTELELSKGRRAKITGRIDLLEVDEQEGFARITDVKSNHQVPTDAEVREDFQLRTYAMLVLDNVPQVERVYGRLWLTRYNIYAPQRTDAEWAREDIEQFRSHLQVRLSAFYDAKLAHEFVPGSWCQYCPRRGIGNCTLWRKSPALRGPITTAKQARRVASRIIATEQQLEGLKAALKAYVNEHGPVSVGDGKKVETFAYHVRESEEVAASDLLEILESAADTVGEVDVNDILSPNRQSKIYKALRRNRELAPLFEAVAHKRLTTTFGHKALGGE